MASGRMRKVDETVKEALAEVLLEDVSDPRLDLVTITSVQVSPDLRHANVYVVTHGGPERDEAMLAGLEAARRRIRSALSRRVRMKYLPELDFHVDRSVDEGMRIAEAIREERESGRVPEGDDGGEG